jgi:uncharacterized protein YqfB (UPF0267 family)
MSWPVVAHNTDNYGIEENSHIARLVGSMTNTGNLEDDLEFCSSLKYFIESTSEQKIELPLIKLALKDDDNSSLCSISVSTFTLDSVSIPHRRKENLRLTIDKVHFKDLSSQNSIGSVSDFKFSSGRDKGEDSCISC